MTEAMLGQLASTGVVGAFLVLALLGLISKDKQLKEQAEKHILALQSGRFITLAMSLQREVIEAVNKLGDMLAFIEKRDEDKRTGISATGKNKPWRGEP